MIRTRRYPHRYLRVLAFLLAATMISACTPPGLPDALPPLATNTTPQAPVMTDLISIGIDSAIAGFNPYVIAQYSPAGRSVASLVLPSVFTSGNNGPDAVPTALVDNVEITSESPFTVTYTLNRGAAWSDGTPIAAEDFSYLWQQMINPDQSAATVSPGGYELISSIASEDGGKTVVVEFAVPYAGWRTLFSPLLPARSLKDDPGGFLTSLTDGLPVAGGQYKMESYDATIGEIKLARNDKFWGAQPGPPAVIFRVGDSNDLIEAFQRGDVNSLYLSPAAQTATALEALAAQDPKVRLTSVPQPASQQLQFNTAPGRIAEDPAIRRGIAAALNTSELGAAAARDWAAGWIAPQAQISLPADPKAVVSEAIPAGSLNDQASTISSLGAAGYQRDGVYFSQDGQVLRINLGFLLSDSVAFTQARLIQRQLGAAGILVNLVALDAAEIQPPLLFASVPDLVLTTVPRTSSDGAIAVGSLGCGAVLNPTAIAASTPVEAPSTTSPSTGADETETGSDSADEDSEPENCRQPTPFQLSELLAGDDPSVMMPSVTPGNTLATTTGTTTDRSATSSSSTEARTTGIGTVSTYQNPDSAPMEMAKAGTVLDAELWERMNTLPLAQPVMLLALGPALEQVAVEPDVSRLLWEGPFQGLPDWPSPN